MRIALLLDVLGDRRGSPGNVRLILEVARELGALGHEVTLVAHDHDPEGPLDTTGLGVRAVHVGPVRRPAGGRAILARYRTGMRRMAGLVETVDVVNAYDWPSLRAGRLAARRLRAPLVWTRNDETVWERALMPARTSRGRGRAAGRLPRLALGLLDLRDARAAAEIVVLSRHDAEMVHVAYRRSARVMPVGCAPAFFEAPDRPAARRRLGIAEGDYLVLGFAVLVAHRRFEDLIAAIAAIEDPSVVGWIGGPDHLDPGYAERLEQEIARRGMDGRIRLCRGPVSECRLRELYAAADLYVFPSLRQSYGQAPLEALAAGTPVVVSAGAGVSDVLRGRPGVSVVEPGDPAALAAAIRCARATGRAAAAATRYWLARELTNRAYAAGMADLYARVIARRSR